MTALTMGSGSSEVLYILIVLVIPLSAIISAATIPGQNFRNASSNKVLWVILPFFFGFIAAVIYWSFIYPRLRRARGV
jgi:hypothetical protein